MTTISSTVYSSLSALNTYSAAINVTSTNIANAESAGYSRQTAVIREKVAGDGTGYGVDVSVIKRSYDSFLTAQLRSANQELGKSSVELEVLNAIEQVFSTSDGSGLDGAMSDFWNAWQEVANDPSGLTARSVLASTAETLADTFNSMSSQLSEISMGIEDGVDETVEKINDLVKQIKEANQDLFSMEVSGQSTNTCKDTLDSLVLELSSLADIRVSTNDVGQVNIQLTNGDSPAYLVDTSISAEEGGSTWTLDRLSTDPQKITRVDSGKIETGEVLTISSGALGGYLLNARDEVAEYQEQLDALAMEIVEEVNDRHGAGYDLEGIPGVDFFSTDTAGAGAGYITVNPLIVNDPGKIAASASGSSGDNSNARDIADLQNELIKNWPDIDKWTNTGDWSGIDDWPDNETTATFSDYYNAIVSKIGTAVQSAEIGHERLSNAQAFYTNASLSVSGVSTDEEMAKLVLYQNAYEAAAKIMSTLDELMQTLINM